MVVTFSSDREAESTGHLRPEAAAPDEKELGTTITYAAQPEVDIEDIVGRSTYAALVNATYALTGPNADGVPSPALPERMTQVVEAHFQTLPPGVAEFDHYRRSEFLLANRAAVLAALPDSDDALDRFERLFKDLTALP